MYLCDIAAPRIHPPVIPWAWGINGFFSVIGTSATVLVAIEWGFKSVVLTALALYILSAVIYRRIERD